MRCIGFVMHVDMYNTSCYQGVCICVQAHTRGENAGQIACWTASALMLSTE